MESKTNLRMGLLTLTLLAFTHAQAAQKAEFVPGEVLVKYKSGAVRTRDSMNALYQDLGVKHVHRYTGTMRGLEHLTLAKGANVNSAIAELMKNDTVEYAQPNYILRLLPIKAASNVHPKDGIGIPCIPGFDIPGCDPHACLIPGIFPPGCGDGGGGDNPNPPTPPAQRPVLKDPPAEVNPPVADPDLSKAWGLQKIGAPQAWEIHRGSKTFVMADIDTGIDYNHEDISGNLWRNPSPTQSDVVGFDFVHNDGLPFDDQMHGTHTGGTIGAVGGNGKGISGVIQKVQLMAVKFLSAEGSGTTADAIKGIDYAITHGAKILSNSWGGPSDGDNTALQDAVERARAKDVLFVAAAGNDNTDNDTPEGSYPAKFTNDNMITVAATDNNDGLASFSNYGLTTVHLGAPGVNVYSSLPGDKYANESGTSMACPHVAGAAALVWSKNPALTYKQVKEILLKSVDQIDSLKGKTITGGRLNVLKALQSME